MMNGTPESWHKWASPEGHLGLLTKRAAFLGVRAQTPRLPQEVRLRHHISGHRLGWDFLELARTPLALLPADMLCAGLLGQMMQTEGLENTSMVQALIHTPSCLQRCRCSFRNGMSNPGLLEGIIPPRLGEWVWDPQHLMAWGGCGMARGWNHRITEY